MSFRKHLSFVRKSRLAKSRLRATKNSFNFERLEPRQLLAANFIISEFVASNASNFLDDNGNQSDWIEIYNAGNTSGNLAGYSLTDNPAEPAKWVFPSINLGVGGFQVLFAADDSAPGAGSNLYTGFSLKQSGDYLGLYNPAGTAVSEYNPGGQDYPVQYSNVSYGKKFVAGVPTEDSYFSTPTPGIVNSNPLAGFTERVFASQNPGFFDASFQVTLTTATTGATIRYTTNGSTPSATNGLNYTGPIGISKTTTLRAVSVKSNFLSAANRTWTYLFLDDVLTQSNNGAAPAGWPSSWGNNTVDYGIDPDVIAIEGAATIKNALKAIPTWSITTDLDNLFSPSTGIYSNAQQDGSGWERAASVELIQPDGSPGFQVNAGLRLRGGASRSNNNPKHAFKLFFRSEYGDANLKYPIHSSGTDTFEKIDLRTAQNYSWSFNGNASNNFIAEVLARNSQAALGEPTTRSSWLHLYLNGQYWGLFQTQERAEANYAATYFGGSADDYDVLKPERGPYTNIATDGNFLAFDRLFQQAKARAADGRTPNFVNNNAYLRAQGLNPDGSRNNAYEVLLDVDNLIAYMTVILSTGNFDAPISRFLGDDNVNNFFAIRNRNGNEGFRYFVHDSEHTLKSVNENRNGPYNDANFESSVVFFNPQWLHQQLMANAEYRLQFADSIYKNYFNGGPLTAEAQLARFNAEATAIDQAIIAESARWGDAKTSTPFLRSHWVTALNDLRNNYIPNRNSVFLQQLRTTVLKLKDTAGNYSITVNAPLFPAVDAPNYIVDSVPLNGGQIVSGSVLQMNAEAGSTIYYTLDGSDPRLFGGAINPAATAYTPSTTVTTVVGAGASWRYNDTGSNLGTAWRAASYNDSGWAAGNAELGYGDGDEATVVSFGGNANFKHVTTYFRKQFNVASGSSTAVKLRLRRDDGAVVFLNGVEVVRDNFNAGTIDYQTFSNTASDDGNTWFEFDIIPSLLVAGVNTLAVEIHQTSRTSSDISFDAELIVTAQNSANSIVLNTTTQVNARTLAANGTWSAVNKSLFFLSSEAAAATNMRITEINYHPTDPTAAELAVNSLFTNGDFEFLEVMNIQSVSTIQLNGVKLTNGVDYDFENVSLVPGERAVVVKNPAAFQARYGTGIRVLGQFSGGLKDSGERITLTDQNVAEIMSVAYGDKDPWSIAADGDGATLVLKSPTTTELNKLDKYYSWFGSVENGGTPGRASGSPIGIVINEVVTNTTAPLTDSIELYNPTANAINIGGWYLSDAGGNPLKYQIPAGTMLASGQYIVFNESHFNPNPTAPGPNHFALNGSLGDQVYLTIGNGSGGVSQWVDAIGFGAAANGQSLGRVPNGVGRFTPLASRTLGIANSAHQLGPVVISEVNYHPGNPSLAALAIEPTLIDDDLEFIEIFNSSSSPVNLTNWRLRGEGDFNFVAGTMLGANSALVIVSFDPGNPLNTNRLAAFRSHYGIGAGVVIVGGFAPHLGNGYGRVELKRPDGPPLNSPLTADEVLYDDLAPWANADGSGNSLNRTSLVAYGNNSSSWLAQVPTPGTANLAAAPPIVVQTIRDSGSLVRPDQWSTLQVVFSTNVVVAKTDLSLVNDTLGGQPVDLNAISGLSFNYNASTFAATWTFADPTVLPAAFFTWKLNSTTVTSTATGIRLDGDGNGSAGGDYLRPIYVAIPGDANLDGDVDVSEFSFNGNVGDLTVVKANLGLNAGVSWSQGDFNGDGDVDVSQFSMSGNQGDLTILYANIGRNVRPPSNNLGSSNLTSSGDSTGDVSQPQPLTPTALIGSRTIVVRPELRSIQPVATQSRRRPARIAIRPDENSRATTETTSQPAESELSVLRKRNQLSRSMNRSISTDAIFADFDSQFELLPKLVETSKSLRIQRIR